MIWAAAAASPASLLAGIQPDYFSAREFAIELQIDHQARKSEALVERLDSAAMMHRVFAPLGDDVVADPRSQEFWENITFPMLKSELQAFDSGYVLLFSRIAVFEDARWAEFILSDADGRFQIAYFRLKPTTAGICIDDLRFAGSLMETSRFTRQLLLLLGLNPMKRLDPEETELTIFAEQRPMLFSDAFQALGQKQYDHAFRRLAELPPKARQTRVWQQLIARLALLGSPLASAHLKEAVESGEPVEPFLRFALISGAGDANQSLAALQSVLNDYHGVPFLRAVRASLLLETGDAAAAYRIASELIEVNPWIASAHMAAVVACIQSGQSDKAFEHLSTWSAWFPKEEIDRLLREHPKVAEFRESSPYRSWLSPEPTEVVPAGATAPSNG